MTAEGGWLWVGYGAFVDSFAWDVSALSECLSDW